MSFQQISRLPITNEELEQFHYDISLRVRRGLRRIACAMSLIYDDYSAKKAIYSLIENGTHYSGSNIISADDSSIGLEKFISGLSDDNISPIDVTVLWKEAAEYAGQGLSPNGDRQTSMVARQAAIEELITKADLALAYGNLIFDDEYDFVWKAVKARSALDFGRGRLSLDDLCLLSGLTLPVVRNAVSIGTIDLDEHQTVAPAQALSWLSHRRGFTPSRWLNLEDDQSLPGFEPQDENSIVFIPQTASGDRFLPATVMRLNRNRSQISISVGGKGKEEQYTDFYAALNRMKEQSKNSDNTKPEPARWRRVNASGHWCLVSARGAWMPINKEELDHLIEEQTKELGL